MRKVVLVIVCLLLLVSAGLASLGCGAKEAEVTWKLATYTMPGDGITKVYENFADLVKNKSDGRMVIEVHPGDLYTGPDSFDGVSSGVVQMASCPSSWYFGKMPKTAAILGTSWSFNPDELLAVRKALVAEPGGLAAAIAEAHSNGVMHTLWISAGYVEFCFDKDVKVMADLAGLNIGSASSTVNKITGGSVMKANAIEVQVADTYMAAQNGQIDGAILPVENYRQLSLYEVLPYLVLTGIFPTTYSTLMNRAAYEALPADLQGVVTEAAAEAEATGVADFKVTFQNSLDEIESHGGHVYTLPAAEQLTWWNSAIWPAFLYGMLTPTLGDADLATTQTIVANAKAAYQASIG